MKRQNTLVSFPESTKWIIGESRSISPLDRPIIACGNSGEGELVGVNI